MKKTIMILMMILSLTAAGCGSQDSAPAISEVPGGLSEASASAGDMENTLPEESISGETTPEGTVSQAETTATAEETPELSYDAYKVVYNLTENPDSESAQFQGIGPDNGIVWTYDVTVPGRGQMPGITPAGSFRDTYYLVAGGTVIALDVRTGNVRFENSEFGGAPCKEAILIDDYGYLYLSGFLGPDFFAMDPEGNTVKRIDSLSQEYYWPYRMEQDENRLVIYMSGGKEDSGDFPCYVEMDWLPQAQG